jgi:hypothetical protein
MSQIGQKQIRSRERSAPALLGAGGDQPRKDVFIEARHNVAHFRAPLEP